MDTMIGLQQFDSTKTDKTTVLQGTTIPTKIFAAQKMFQKNEVGGGKYKMGNI